MDEMRAIESFATFTAKESELLGRAEHALHRQPDELVHCLAYLGFALGFPWSRREAHHAGRLAFSRGTK
jgi:hypothetical protein